MYFCYLDESGVPDSGGTSHFVYAGIAIPSHTWPQKDREIVALKAKYGLQDSEIHAGWLARKYVEQDKVLNFKDLNVEDRRRAVQKERQKFLAIWAVSKTQKQLKEKRKNFKETEPYIHLTYDERRAFLRDLAQSVGKWSDSRLFAEAANKMSFNPIKCRTGGLYEESFHQVVTRFEAFLHHKGEDEGQTHLGLLISDNNESVNRKLTAMMRQFHSKGTLWRDIKNIVETPLFVDSKLTSMIQIIDLVSYAIRRFCENNETELFNLIYQRFDRVRGRVVGIRHFTKGQCQCRICYDHNKPYAQRNGV